MNRRTSSRRGMILIAVLIVITIAAFVGMAGMFAADVRVTSAGASIRAAQARALAWSGVQAAMAELADQRDAIIAGRDPIVTGEWELYKSGGVRGVVRLLPIGANGAKFESESAKLDVNSATPAMLAKLPGWSDALASAVVSARLSRPIQSLAELAHSEGVTPEMIDGPSIAQGRNTSDASSNAFDRVLTPYSFDPDIQIGIGEGASDHRGLRRVLLDGNASDDLVAGVKKRLGDPLAAKVDAFLKAQGLKTRADLVKVIQGSGIDQADWPRLLDLFDASSDPYAPGRVDVNRASVDVLAAIPGFDPASARRVVDTRAGVASERLASPAWLLQEGILNADQFQQAANYLSVRSFQWRVVVEAGVTTGGDSDSSSTLGEAPLSSRVRLEAVIDIASKRPRVAFLRDVTLADAARELAVKAAPDQEPQVDRSAPAGPTPAPAGPAPSAPELPKADATAPAPPIPEGPVDRRLGRWTAGGQSGAQ